MSREVLEEIARGEFAANELGLPEPVPYFIELSDVEWIDGRPTPERMRRSLEITSARTATERWTWVLQWGRFVAALNPRQSQAVVEADDCHLVSGWTEEQ